MPSTTNDDKTRTLYARPGGDAAALGIPADLDLEIRIVAQKLARRHRTSGVSADEIAHEGRVAAWEVSKRYDPTTGNKLSTFLRPRAIGGMLDYVRDCVTPFSRLHWQEMKAGECAEIEVRRVGNTPWNDHHEYAATVFDPEVTDGPRAEFVAWLRASDSGLTPNDAAFLADYFAGDATMKVIAWLYGVTESRISQRIAAMISPLKTKLTPPPLSLPKKG